MANDDNEGRPDESLKRLVDDPRWQQAPRTKDDDRNYPDHDKIKKLAEDPRWQGANANEGRPTLDHIKKLAEDPRWQGNEDDRDYPDVDKLTKIMDDTRSQGSDDRDYPDESVKKLVDDPLWQRGKAEKDAPPRSGPTSHFAANNQQIVAELMSCKTKLDILNVMNKYHAYVIDGGRARIFREVNKYIQSLEISAFKGWCANKSIPITTADPDGKTETKYIKLYDFWYTHFMRFEYNDVGFDPRKTFDRNDRSNDVYDMWRGWETIGEKGEVKEILRFIYEIICNKNRKHFFWVLSWIADLIQNPADPKGVALVLIGPKGIGKTFFAEIICSLVGDKYSFITANKKDVFGDFSGHLSNLMFIVLEEAVWAANHQNEAILKVLITGKRRSSESKYHDTRMVNNYLRSLILANPGWAVPISLDERRYMVLNPSVERMKDLTYFGALQRMLDKGAREALMYFFERYRIGRGGVDIRSALKTEGFYDQQDEGLEPFESWLLEEFLWAGVVKCCGLDAGMQINRNEVYEQYLDWHKKMDARGKKLNSKKFGIKFGSYFPKYDEIGNIQKAKNGRIISIFTNNDTTNTQGHIYDFPSLKETRDIVVKTIGRMNYDWEGGGIEWAAHPNSAHLPKEGNAAPHVDMHIDDTGNVIIPMRRK